MRRRLLAALPVGLSPIVTGVIAFRLWRNNRRLVSARRAGQHG